MPLTIEDIQKLPEGQTFDCKSIQVSAKALAIPIVAMANADGGTIAVGVSDTNRRIEGIDQEPKHLNDLLCVPMDMCVPSVDAKFSYLPCTDEHGRENRILLIHIPASIRLHTTQTDECYMRVGDKSKKLNFDERLQLMSDKGLRHFEDEPVPNATLDDINMDAVADLVRTIGYGKSPIEYLRENNDFVTVKDGKERISNACILLFGKNPQRFFQRARTRFIRYEGTEEKFGRDMNVIKDVTFEGTLLEQVRRTVEYLETQVREHSYLGEHGIFVTNRNYSQFAIQELVVNSVCHRDYSIIGTEIQIKMFDDRIVFETPGHLPGLVRPENIRHTHFSRNPKIALFMKAYKLVKEFGEGVDRICTELEQTGTPILTFTFHPNSFILLTTIHEEVFPDAGKTRGGLVDIQNTEGNLSASHDQKQNILDKMSDNHVVEPVVDKLTERQRVILAIIRQFVVDHVVDSVVEDGVEIPSANSMAKQLKTSSRTIQRELAYLRTKGRIHRVDGDNGGHWEIINDNK